MHVLRRDQNPYQNLTVLNGPNRMLADAVKLASTLRMLRIQVLRAVIFDKRRFHAVERCSTRILAHRARLRSADQRAQKLRGNCIVGEVNDPRGVSLKSMNDRVIAFKNESAYRIAVDIKRDSAVRVQRGL